MISRKKGSKRISMYGPKFRESREFFYRRIHSLLGIVPVGIFLIMHIATNFLITATHPGHDQFQEQVDRIHALGPFLIPVEVFFILIPLGFHAGLGIKFWLEGQSNIVSYQYWGNIRYTMQRLTGMVALVFIIVHLWHMHWLLGWLPGGGQFLPEQAAATAADALQATWWWSAPLYAIGVVASCFHFANGIWTFLITWGVTIGPKAQRDVGFVCAAIGLALTIAGLVSLRSFLVYPYAKPAEAFEADQDLGPVELMQSWPADAAAD